MNLIADVLDVDIDTIKNLNNSVIFNSYVKSGFNNMYNANYIEKIHQLHDQLLKEKDNQINTLKELINHIKK